MPPESSRKKITLKTGLVKCIISWKYLKNMFLFDLIEVMWKYQVLFVSGI